MCVHRFEIRRSGSGRDLVGLRMHRPLGRCFLASSYGQPRALDVVMRTVEVELLVITTTVTAVAGSAAKLRAVGV